MSKKSKKRKRRVVFIGYYKINFISGFLVPIHMWEYYKRYSDGHYFYWNRDWGETKQGAWCWGGEWRERIRFRPATRVSKLEMLVVNGPESVK